MRPLVILAFAGIFSACTLLDPPSAEAQKAVKSANTDLQALVETARLGAYAKPSSFQDAAPLYGSMIARLKSAKPPADETGPEKDLGRVIDGCISNVSDLSELHQSSGLRATLEYDPFTLACAFAESAIEETF
ncbi:MAG: hypothetical protein AB8B47_03880 [Roseobacter sp.]